MGAPRRHRIGLPGGKPHLLFRFLQKETHLAIKYIERVADMRVMVPGHGLNRRKLQFGDSKPWTLGMARSTLHLVEMASVLQWFQSFRSFHASNIDPVDITNKDKPAAA